VVTSGGGRLVERYEYTPYGQRTVYSHGWLRADFNQDGAVDVIDNAILGDYFGHNVGYTHGDDDPDLSRRPQERFATPFPIRIR